MWRHTKISKETRVRLGSLPAISLAFDEFQKFWNSLPTTSFAFDEFKILTQLTWIALVARTAWGAVKATAASGENAKRATKRFCIVIMVSDLVVMIDMDNNLAPLYLYSVSVQYLCIGRGGWWCSDDELLRSSSFLLVLVGVDMIGWTSIGYWRMTMLWRRCHTKNLKKIRYARMVRVSHSIEGVNQTNETVTDAWHVDGELWLKIELA